MKQSLILFLLVLLTYTLTAQKNMAKIGIGAMPTPYEGILAPGAEIQYQRKVTPGTWLVLAGGAHSGTEYPDYRSSGFDNTGSWDRRYTFKYKEQVLYADIQALGEVLHTSFLNIKLGGGLSAIKVIYDLPADATVIRGEVISETRSIEKRSSAMLNAALELEGPINNKVLIGLKTVFRTRVTEKYPITTIQRDQFGMSTSTSSLLSALNITLNVGYRF